MLTYKQKTSTDEEGAIMVVIAW